MPGWYGIKFWWQLSSSDQSWELLRSSDSLGLLVSGNQGPGLHQESVKLNMLWPKMFFPRNCFPRHAELYHTSEEKTKPPPQKRNKSIEVFSDGIMRMLARQQVPWNQNTVNQICIPSVRVVGIDRRPRWTSKLGTWTFASSERSDTTQAWQ